MSLSNLTFSLIDHSPSLNKDLHDITKFRESNKHLQQSRQSDLAV